MRYKNAAEVLPSVLLREIQYYIEGELLYIPKSETKKEWGAVSGSKKFYSERNSRIRELFHDGMPIQDLAKQFGLSGSTIKKIIYQKK
ncbi:MAG: helix-turn-helix domain-containing protein [Lachnospiraceae bacterium]|nr:helix-turn-helix domain-containing protein [Lachnospiraceae bacterium]MBD5482631.1 helix-turn-helix domain-containing protein [Lachnospiraceae bacterium]